MLDLARSSAPALMDMLPAVLTQKIKQCATLKHYPDGGIVHSRGDEKPGLSIVKSGAVHAGVYGEDGSLILTTVLGPGQAFGLISLFAQLPRTHDMTASGPTEIYQVPAARFMKLYDSEPELSQALFSTALLRMHILMELLDAVRRLPMLERTAKVLTLVMKMSGEGNCFKCRQSDLAFTLGVSRVTLGKALKQLQALDLIETGYGEIRVNSADAMAEWIARHCDVKLAY